jgi:putrescine carbamoyltransferase
MRHFLDTQDFTKDELQVLLDLARLLKAADQEGALPALLVGASLGLISVGAPPKNQISYNVAMTKLGGHCLHVPLSESDLATPEAIKDLDQSLGGLVNALSVHALDPETLAALAEVANMPLIHGGNAQADPTQALCDLFTIQERLPPGKSLEEVQLVFMGAASPLSASLMVLSAKFGLHFTQCAPLAYHLPQAVQEISGFNCLVSGGQVHCREDYSAAIETADFIYSGAWWSPDQLDQIEARSTAFGPLYRITQELMDQAPRHALFLRDPASVRGLEASNEVIDSGASLGATQALNRLYTHMTLLVAFMDPHLKRPSHALKDHHSQRIARFLVETALPGAGGPR